MVIEFLPLVLKDKKPSIPFLPIVSYTVFANEGYEANHSLEVRKLLGGRLGGEGEGGCTLAPPTIFGYCYSWTRQGPS